MEAIKDGLSCSVESSPGVDANVYLLTRQQDRVTITCRFSGADCGLSFSDDTTHLVEFDFQNHYLQSFSQPGIDFGASSFPAYHEHECCCNTQMILHDVVKCRLDGVSRTIFLESKALALLLCSLQGTRLNKTCALQARRDGIEAARRGACGFSAGDQLQNVSMETFAEARASSSSASVR